MPQTCFRQLSVEMILQASTRLSFQKVCVRGVLMREDIRRGQVRIYCLHFISEWLDLPSSRDSCEFSP